MPRIFISYRRADSAPYAGRIYDRLVNQFGGDSVFMDVDSIRPGLDFVHTVEAARYDVMLVVIGTEWLSARDKDGRTRLDNPHDLVRREVASGLNQGAISVIPILVGGASLPSAEELPPDLMLLSRRQAIEVSHANFHRDADGLIRVLGNLQSAAFTEPLRPSSIRLLTALVSCLSHSETLMRRLGSV